MGNKKTLNILRNLIYKYNPDYVFLMETKCDYDKMVNNRRSLRFYNVELAEARGYAKDIALFWQDCFKLVC